MTTYEPSVLHYTVAGQTVPESQTKALKRLAAHLRYTLERSLFKDTPIEVHVIYTVHGKPFLVFSARQGNHHRCYNKIKAFKPAYNRLKKKLKSIVDSFDFSRSHLHLSHFTPEEVKQIAVSSYDLFGPSHLTTNQQGFVPFEELSETVRDITYSTVEFNLSSPEALRECPDESDEIRELRHDFYEVVIAQAQAVMSAKISTEDLKKGLEVIETLNETKQHVREQFALEN